LTKVDDFGLGKDDSGKSFFYVKEVTNQKSRTIFVYLTDDDTVFTRTVGDGGIIGGIECENEKCCSTCVVNNGSCVCHTHDHDCQRNGETEFTCKQSAVAVRF